jgi:hypothetical protein
MASAQQVGVDCRRLNLAAERACCTDRDPEGCRVVLEGLRLAQLGRDIDVRRLLRRVVKWCCWSTTPIRRLQDPRPKRCAHALGVQQTPEARKHWPCALQSALMCPLTAELGSQKAPESGDPPATTPRRRHRGPRHRSPRPQPHPGIRPPELCLPDHLNAYREVADLQDFTNRRERLIAGGQHGDRVELAPQVGICAPVAACCSRGAPPSRDPAPKRQATCRKPFPPVLGTIRASNSGRSTDARSVAGDRRELWSGF